jgi:TFIIF-interacting CTD phosphatase-like protein
MVLSEGHYTKDLKYLNRNLKDIIVIDKDLKNINKYTENAIILK